MVTAVVGWDARPQVPSPADTQLQEAAQCPVAHPPQARRTWFHRADRSGSRAPLFAVGQPDSLDLRRVPRCGSRDHPRAPRSRGRAHGRRLGPTDRTTRASRCSPLVPGHANGLSALFVAREAESPLVVLSGQSAQCATTDRGAFQEMPQAQLAQPLTKAAWTAEDPAIARRRRATARLTWRRRVDPVRWRSASPATCSKREPRAATAHSQIQTR